MDRRDFLGLGLLPLTAAPALAAAPARPMSRAAQAGWLPNVPLVAHTGQTVRFYDDLIRDRTVLFNFFLVTCTDGECPSATANLRAAQDLLGERMGRDVFFYSISLNPREETPAVLREYAALFDIRPGWLFLTGKPADIELLRRSQGFVDSDPERDKDATLHTAMARYGNDRLERWGALSVRSTAKNIASTFKWLNA
ncbi:MAG: SCO family protein [Dechloromonas sp.]|nr:SCO family protein [Dechloromonas sp.]